MTGFTALLRLPVRRGSRRTAAHHKRTAQVLGQWSGGGERP